MLLKILLLLLIIILFCIDHDGTNVFVQAYTAAGTNTLIGIVGDGFVLLAADTLVDTGGNDIVIMKASGGGVDKIAILEPYNIAAAVAGNMADADHIVTALQTTCRIHAYQNSVPNDIHLVDCSNHHKIIIDVTTAAEPTGTIIMNPPFPKNNMDDVDELTVECIAHAARNQIARRMNVCALIAGMMRKRNHQDDNNNNNNNHHLFWKSSMIADPVRRQIQAATTSEKDEEEDGTKPSSHEAALRQDDNHKEQPALFWLDEYGSLQRVLYGAHGYASSLLWSVLDRGYRHNRMSLDEALHLLDECLKQLRIRYVYNSQPLLSSSTTTHKNGSIITTTAATNSRFCIKCIDANGIHVITR
jgi:20S proteasome alpha/beta subunit